MSDLARRQRLARRAWAATGSSHDRLIATLRILLPIGVGILVAFLAVAPMTLGRDLSFILSKNQVEVSREYLHATHAAYRGTDGKGQPFRLDAASAVQTTSRDPVVKLSQLSGRIQLVSGPATVVSPAGRYDLDSQHVAFDGPVRFVGGDGYRIDTSNVLLDMTSKTLASRGPVTGSMRMGTFAADRLTADLDAHTVNLDGRARLHIVQSHARRAR